jgi:RNA polymerase sigma-70 factor (ECF subfamily)
MIVGRSVREQPGDQGQLLQVEEVMQQWRETNDDYSAGNNYAESAQLWRKARRELKRKCPIVTMQLSGTFFPRNKAMSIDDPQKPHTLRTNTELLLGLQDAGNDVTWSAFVQRYRPVLVAFGKRLGLSHDTAMDAAQEALMTFLDSYLAGKYTRDKGRLRSWLFGIARNSVRRQWRKAPREQQVAENDGSTAFVNKIVGDDSISDAWEQEWRQAVLNNCIDELRKTCEPQTMRAFELYVLNEWPADKVAKEVGITRDSVFQAKRRLMKKMREMLESLEHDW